MTRCLTAKDDRPMVIEICGAQFVPDHRGGLYWPDEKMLIVSDLHFEKGSSFATKGVLLPPYDSRSTLAVVKAICDDWNPETVIALGDSFHDGEAEARLSDLDRQHIRSLTSAYDWIWILGNHDPKPPKDLGGRVMHELIQGAFTLRHEPQALPLTGEIAGHLHPCARVQVEGRRIRRRCFISDGRRLVMPALGAYTGGLNVRDAAYESLFQDGFTTWVLGKDQVYPIAGKNLIADPGA